MIGLALVVVKIAVQVIRKEKYPKHSKHNEKFNKHNDPECFAYSHFLESIAKEAV
jgi:hypothetical protein